MPELSITGRPGGVRFTGTREELLGIMVRGYLGMLPTLGLYRFWMVTSKRRFYWSHTEIDGDTLEYTGEARQLLVGFMLAVLVFIPIYGLLFLLSSTQTPAIILAGYGGIGLILWFLIGYAIYRTRDFRLSRTLWRGVRFDQRGSAFGYAVRRFLWSLLMVLTAGLAYPFMAGNLWGYRYRHTWFGDRQFSFAGSWKTVAGPYYLVYLGAALFVVAITADLVGRHDYRLDGKGSFIPGGAAVLLAVALFAFLLFGVYFYRGREISRMFSSIRIGDAAVSVTVRGRSMFGQSIVYVLGLVGAVTVFGVLFAVVLASAMMPFAGQGRSLQPPNIAAVLQGSFVNVAMLVFGYLALLATFAALAEIVMGFGYWKLVAREALISNVASLKTVHASAEDKSLVGEGIASALNLGSY